MQENKKKSIIISVVILLIIFGLSYFSKNNESASIQIISPKSGDVLTTGSTQTIKWVSKNVPLSNKVAINIRRIPPPPLQEEGQEFDPLIFTDLPNTGSKEWTVSDMYPNGKYILGITSYVSVPVTNPLTAESGEFIINKTQANGDYDYSCVEPDGSFCKILNTVEYLCNGGKSIKAVFYEGEPSPVSAPGEPPISNRTVKITLSDGRSMRLKQTISADGERYANPDESFVFWGKGNGALILENNQEKSYIGCMVISSDTGGLPNVYSNGTEGFSIRYPKDYSINTSYKYQELGPGKDIYGVKFTIPESMKTGTNLSSFDTGVSVEILPAAKNCNAGLFLYQSVVPKSETYNNIEYSVVSITDAAAGNRYEETVYAIPGTNPCLAVRYFIHYSAIENYDPGTVKEFDKQALLNQLDQIRRSLIIQ